MSLRRLKQILQIISSFITVSLRILLRMSQIIVDECETVLLTETNFSILSWAAEIENEDKFTDFHEKI